MSACNSEKPLISVLVPVFNAEGFLSTCLEGILSQTYPHFEVLCADDASTDRSVPILEQYARKDSRIKILKQPRHHGVAVMRNLLLQHVSGKYVAFIDADDCIAATYLEHLYQTASKEDADVVRCLYELLDHKTGKRTLCEARYKEFVNAVPPQTSLQRLQAALDDSQVWLKLIKTSLIKDNQISFIPHVLPEDISFEILLYQYARKIAFVEEHLYQYRVGNIKSASSNQQLCAYGTLEAMVFLCEDLVRRNLVERKFYEKIIALTLHAVRRMRKYSFAETYPVEKTCRDAFDRIEKFLDYCGPLKQRKYRLMCRLARELPDKQLSYLACVIR